MRQSGKNSADIRLVVDALDLCYTKSHVDTFVIISGDSDFSPLVSKLRENAKQVIGVGVKQSTSDLLIANCDEFIFYDDLVRETQRVAARREPKEVQPARRAPEDDSRRKEEIEARKTKGIEIAVQTFDALVAERGDSGKIWASVLKEAIKRRKPDFSETRYGFRAFGNLLEEAQVRGLLEFGRDEKSGAYVYRSSAARQEPVPVDATVSEVAAAQTDAVAEPLAVPEAPAAKPDSRRKRTSSRKSAKAADAAPEPAVEAPPPEPAPMMEAEADVDAPPKADSRRKRSNARKSTQAVEAAPVAPETAAEAPAAEAKPAARRRRTRKTES